MDTLTKERRSWNMSRIKSKNTMPELIVRQILRGIGYKYRLNSNLPGKPDIVIGRIKTVFLIHGCFWHRHPDCEFSYTPKSNIDFWVNKFDQNTKRDVAVLSQLNELGWTIETIWECETADEQKLTDKLKALLSKQSKKHEKLKAIRTKTMVKK